MHWHQLRSQISQVFQVTSHVVGIFALHFVSPSQLLSLYPFIQFLTCTRIPCRDSHFENGLVRRCLYSSRCEVIMYHLSKPSGAKIIVCCFCVNPLCSAPLAFIFLLVPISSYVVLPTVAKMGEFCCLMRVGHAMFKRMLGRCTIWR